MAWDFHDSRQWSQIPHDAHYEHISVAAGAKAHIGPSFSFATDDPLRQLHFAHEAPHNSYFRQHESTCLEGTRIEVLEEIRGWAEGVGKPSIFWLNGSAGAGKSTIAQTISQHYSKPEQPHLGASFFFSRDGRDVNHARHFVSTIALQLATKAYGLRQRISQAVSENSNITSYAIREQWNHLVIQPLSQQDNNAFQWPILIVVDALDECEHDAEVTTILHILSEIHSGPASDRIRILLTSRPDLPIRPGFRRMPSAIHYDLVLHKVSRDNVDRDIRSFVKHEFEQIVLASDYPLDNWPSETQIEQLVRKADGLFIFASTMCKYIANEQWSQQELLKNVLSPRTSTIAKSGDTMSAAQSTWELDRMYTQILERPFRKLPIYEDRDALLRTLRKILGSIVTAAQPLSIRAMAALINVREDVVATRLQHLHAVLDIPRGSIDIIRISHPSFREFLLDETRCQNQKFWVNEIRAQRILADGCILVMSALKRDICRQNSSRILASDVETSHIQHCIPVELQYACKYWIHHFEQSEERSFDDNGTVHQFLLEHLLHWLEALSWIGKMSEGILVVRRLASINNASQSPRLNAFVYDAMRFVMYARPSVEKCPLQVYISAILFAPSDSLVRRMFERKVRPLWILQSPQIGEYWRPLLQTLEGHSGEVKHVVFSPDGKTLASASHDETVRLWDAETGEALQRLEGHSSWVTHVVFSPDGKRLASASYDRTVRLWDAETGETLQRLEGHSDAVTHVMFSPDGKRLASASHDETVRLWDAETGEAVQRLEGHSDEVTDVMFSPDGKRLASASHDKTVRLWDAETGEALQRLEGHSGGVWHAMFSPDGKRLASASGDKTVRLWDAETGEAVHILEGHSGEVRHVLFSSDGKRLIVFHTNGVIQNWDTESGALLGISDDHKDLQRTAYPLVGIENEWITWKVENAVWLPPEFRSESVATFNNLIALGHESGYVTFWRFG